MLAQFSHYLHNNQCPSKNESLEIRAIKANPFGEISKIDEEIDRVESILDSLRQKRAEIQKSVDDCNIIVAPVRRLSADILGIIFDYCLATHRNPIMSPWEAPILLTQICHDWRSVALSIPRLWSRMYIPLLQTAPPPLAFDTERIEARSEEVQRWLRLSTACPLSIAITLIPRDAGSLHRPTFYSIIVSSRRWRQLELGDCRFNSEIFGRILELSTDDLCMLRDLRLYSTYCLERGRYGYTWHQSGLFNTPSLRNISIVELGEALPLGPPPNWKTLTRLFIHSKISARLANELLSHCSYLVACSLQIYSTWTSVGNTPFVPEYAYLPYLKFLSLRGSRIECNSLYGQVYVPSLRYLDCMAHFPTENEESGLFYLIDGLTTNKSLETLKFDFQDLTRENAIKFYTHAPSLMHLALFQSPKRELRSSPDQVAPLYELRHSSSPDSVPTLLLPSLEVFEAQGIQDTTDSVLLEFIKARVDAAKSNTGVSKLRKVKVHFGRAREIDIVPEALAYAQASGNPELELELVYNKKSDGRWLPSSGLTQQDTSWVYPSCDY